MLKPGTWILPHKGYEVYSEKTLRFHLGVKLPKEGDFGIRVGSTTQKWEYGKGLVFDDMNIHEAWNFTSENRYVLILDFYKDQNCMNANGNGNNTNSNFYSSNIVDNKVNDSKLIDLNEGKFADSFNEFMKNKSNESNK